MWIELFVDDTLAAIDKRYSSSGLSIPSILHSMDYLTTCSVLQLQYVWEPLGIKSTLRTTDIICLSVFRIQYNVPHRIVSLILTITESHSHDDPLGAYHHIESRFSTSWRVLTGYRNHFFFFIPQSWDDWRHGLVPFSPCIVPYRKQEEYQPLSAFYNHYLLFTLTAAFVYLSKKKHIY
jgi:hypothetical protein